MGTLFNSEEDRVSGIGGWLILVAIGIVFSPIRIAGQIIPVYTEVFKSGVWSALTTPGSPNYHPLWAPLLLGEIGTNLLLIALWIFIAVLFFNKKKSFPKWYIGAMAFSLGFVVINAFSIKIVMPDAPVFDVETATEIGRTVIATAIWIPYMLVSERVANTFVE
ncbi:MAG: DUF2569 domain-containing protein [Acidobacteriota bacterium]|nr:MAG: DUF2569 domain-containing protein [Acidobacteriota bacterium]